VLGALASGGPASLLPLARERGFSPKDGYASKCHLCWSMRRFFAARGEFSDELGPLRMYGQNPG
jgi:hypothetical protein